MAVEEGKALQKKMFLMSTCLRDQEHEEKMAEGKW